MLGIGHTLAVEQPFGCRAIAAHHSRIDRHINHGVPLACRQGLLPFAVYIGPASAPRKSPRAGSPSSSTPGRTRAKVSTSTATAPDAFSALAPETTVAPVV